MRSALRVLSFALLLARPATADTLVLADGKVLEGQVVEASETAVRIVLDTGREVVLPVDAIESSSYHAHRKRFLDPADAPGLMALAEFAVLAGLLAEAEADANAARAADPTLDGAARRVLDRVRDLRAERLLDRARDARIAGDLAAALELVKSILIDFESSPAAALAERELDEIARILEDQRRAARDQRLAGSAPPPQAPAAGSPEAEVLDRLLAYADRLGSLGEASHREGLDWDGRGVVNKASQAYERASLAYRQALAVLAHAASAAGQAARLAEVESRVAKSRADLVESYVAGAYLFAAERNWRDASVWVDLALAIDPAHKYALKIRQKISEEYIRRSALQRAIAEPQPRE